MRKRRLTRRLSGPLGSESDGCKLEACKRLPMSIDISLVSRIAGYNSIRSTFDQQILLALHASFTSNGAKLFCNLFFMHFAAKFSISLVCNWLIGSSKCIDLLADKRGLATCRAFLPHFLSAFGSRLVSVWPSDSETHCSVECFGHVNRTL